MAILKNVEIHFAKLDPKRPSKKLSPKNPTWEIQMRTSNKKQKDEWNALNIKTKAVREDPTDEESKILYYRANLKKKSLKVEKDGSTTPAAPVSVVNGKQEDLDPNSIGNGSVCNIRIFQHDYVFEGVPGIASVLMAVQVIKHVLYTPKAMEEFDDAETETIIPDDDEDENGEGGEASTGAAPNGKSDDEF